jgi:glycine cleavage system transcriptional repressor
MVHRAVLSAIGPDRPGLVDEVSKYVYERGGNVEESRMANLHGQFAMMMLFAGDDKIMARCRADLGRLHDESGLHAELVAADLGRPAGAAPAVPYRLTTSAMDHPGLMQSVSHLLGTLDVNIESAETTVQPAPVTGVPVFQMEIVLAVPPETAVAELREQIGRLCDEQNMDWRLAAL